LCVTSRTQRDLSGSKFAISWLDDKALTELFADLAE